MKKTSFVILVFMVLTSTYSFAQDAAAPAPVMEEKKPAPESIAIGVKVKMDYTLTVNGEQVETSKGDVPLEYIHGQGMIIPGLEKALEGMKIGESKTVVVKPEEGYGPINPEMVVDLPKNKLAEGVEAEKDMVLQFPTQDGNTIIGKVLDVMESDLKVDFNHPLAGKNLTFDITIVGLE